jgi:hypothetical protein
MEKKIKNTSEVSSDETYLTPDELVSRYRGLINTRTLANWRHVGEGPAFLKAGGKVLYPMSAVLEYEARRTKVL